MASSRIVIEARSGSLPKTLIKADEFEWLIDEPESFGGNNEGPSPVATLLAAIAACVVATGHWVAKEMHFLIEYIEVIVEGSIDSSKFYGIKTEKRAGFQAIDLSISISADVDDATMSSWLDQVLDRCPVIDNLINPVEVSAEIKRLSV